MPSERWHDAVQVKLDDFRAVPFVTAQVNVPANYVASAASGEFVVMCDQHGAAIVCVDGEIVVACLREAGPASCPCLVSSLAENSGDPRVNVLIEKKAQDQATISRRTVSTSAGVRSG